MGSAAWRRSGHTKGSPERRLSERKSRETTCRRGARTAESYRRGLAVHAAPSPLPFSLCARIRMSRRAALFGGANTVITWPSSRASAEHDGSILSKPTSRHRDRERGEEGEGRHCIPWGQCISGIALGYAAASLCTATVANHGHYYAIVYTLFHALQA